MEKVLLQSTIMEYSHWDTNLRKMSNSYAVEQMFTELMITFNYCRDKPLQTATTGLVGTS